MEGWKVDSDSSVVSVGLEGARGLRWGQNDLPISTRKISFRGLSLRLSSNGDLRDPLFEVGLRSVTHSTGTAPTNNNPPG